MPFLDRRAVSKALGVTLLTAGLPALAQPAKQGRLVIGFGAGNPFDSLARLLNDKIHGPLDMTMIVENKPGSGGGIAAEMIKNSPADGTVIWLSPFSTLVMEPIVNKPGTHFDPLRDFTPVTQVATYDIALAVGPSAPAKSLADYIAMVKADPSKGMFGTPGSRNLPHFFTLLVGKAAGVSFTNVPFKSAGEAITSALGDHTAAVTSGLGDLIEMHRDGKLRILATSGVNRSRFLPDVPTFKEQGFDVQGRGWFGVLLPPKSARDVVMRVNKAVTDALATTDLIDFMQKGGLDSAPTGPEVFAEIIRNDIDFWGTAVLTSGIALEN
jgi:tripartite-type tricarboxylate transporter receptor subunit TctC